MVFDTSDYYFIFWLCIAILCFVWYIVSDLIDKQLNTHYLTTLAEQYDEINKLRYELQRYKNKFGEI